MKPLIDYVPRGWWGLPAAGIFVILVGLAYSLLLIGASRAFPSILDTYSHAGVVERQLFGLPYCAVIAGVAWLTFRSRKLFGAVLALYVFAMALWTAIVLMNWG